MKTTIKILTVSALVSIASCGSAKNNTTNTQTETNKEVTIQKEKVAKNVNATEFQKLIANDGVILDVRTPGEYSAGHIENSKNINFHDKNFMRDVAKLNKNEAIYIYCRSGGRSGRAMNKLKAAGFTKIYNLSGGFNGWSRSGLPSVK